MMEELSCFKAYDIRGRVPTELNEDLVYRIGTAYARFLKPNRVVIGRDMRLSSNALAQALSQGLMDRGVDVFDLGLCGTEEVYFATCRETMQGGIMITASHNPKDFNGLKLVRESAKPISSHTGLERIKSLVQENQPASESGKGTLAPLDCTESYIEHLLSYIDTQQLSPLRIVVNAGNGVAGKVVDLLAKHLPFEFIKIQFEPDGEFPNGVPNPLLPENRIATQEAIQANYAHLGIAWDGDFDRCFFFDHRGQFIEGYYIVGLLATALLKKNPGAKIIHDPRLTWNTLSQVQASGGITVQHKAGHAFIKERMRKEDAVYGGEMSAHHYFRDFAYCDSGMIPWLLLTEVICATGVSLADMVREATQNYPCSGEINFAVDNPQEKINRVLAAYALDGPMIDYTDGVSADFNDWRFNLRPSNTEPLLRLNVETRGDYMGMLSKAQRIGEIINYSIDASRKLSRYCL